MGSFKVFRKQSLKLLDSLHLISLSWFNVDEKEILNAFLKEVFSKFETNDEMTPPEEHTLEAYTKEGEFIPADIDIDVYIDCDMDVNSTTGIQIISDLFFHI